MIRKSSEMPSLLLRIIADVETEVVEYKAAKQNYDFEDIGKYFSALSNEANLRNAECGWLFFGISNDRQIKGTAYRKESQMPSVGLRRLKHEIAQYTNNGMTFEEIFEFEVNGKRIVAFQIPAGSFATPTTWHGIPFYSGTVDLHAGETTTITYTLTTSAEAGDKPLTLRQTPTCQAARDSASS